MRESAQLAEFVATTKFDDIPADLRERFKAYALDTLSAGFVGCRLPWSEMVHAEERENSAGSCTIFGASEGLGPASAALVNGTMVGAFEAEHSAHVSHAGGTVLPAALAAAENVGASGRELMLAMVMGYEVVCRVGEAQTRLVEDVRGFHNPAANGCFSAAAAVGKVLGLSAADQLNAFGIAGSRAGGLTEFTWEGAMTKRLHIGLGNRRGLESAYLARRGFTGPSTVFEGTFGFLNAFSPDPRPEELVQGLGSEWLSRDVKIKPYAAHGSVQPVIAALDKLVRDESLSAASITGMRIRTDVGHHPPQPVLLNPKPTTMLGAQLSMPFVMAVAVHRDLSDPLQLNESALTDPDILKLAAAIEVEDLPGQTETTIEVMAGATTYKLDVVPHTGSLARPAQWDDIEDKFRRYSRHVIDIERQQAIIDVVQSLDTLADVKDLTALLRVG